MTIGFGSACEAKIRPNPNAKDTERTNMIIAAALCFSGVLCHKKASEKSILLSSAAMEDGMDLFDIN